MQHACLGACMHARCARPGAAWAGAAAVHAIAVPQAVSQLPAGAPSTLLGRNQKNQPPHSCPSAGGPEEVLGPPACAVCPRFAAAPPPPQLFARGRAAATAAGTTGGRRASDPRRAQTRPGRCWHLQAPCAQLVSGAGAGTSGRVIQTGLCSRPPHDSACLPTAWPGVGMAAEGAAHHSAQSSVQQLAGRASATRPLAEAAPRLKSPSSNMSASGGEPAGASTAWMAAWLLAA